MLEPSLHDRKVSIFERCLVEIVGSRFMSFPAVIPSYKFPSLDDALSFQSSLRGKYLRGSFDANTISSLLGEIASDQTIKVWSDFDDEQRSLTFYQHKAEHKDALVGYRDFPIDWFESATRRRTENDRVVRIKFHFAEKKKGRISSWATSVSSSVSKFSRRFSGSSTGPIAATETPVLQRRPTTMTFTIITKLTNY